MKTIILIVLVLVVCFFTFRSLFRLFSKDGCSHCKQNCSSCPASKFKNINLKKS